MSEHKSDQQAVIDAAIASTEAEELESTRQYAWVVSDGASVVRADLESALEAPRRARGTYWPATVEDLIDYVRVHDLSRATTLWVHPTDPRVVAVLNDSEAESAGWGDHRAELKLVQTPEWGHWLSLDGEQVDQVRFAEHVEDGLAEVLQPDGATLMEIAQTFNASTQATFRSAQRLHSGAVQVQYDEEIAASAGSTRQIEIPQEFLLALAPFVGEDPVEVRARLRYRVRAGNLTLGYRLDHPERVVKGVLDRLRERLNESFERVYLGAPANPVVPAPPLTRG